MATYQLGSALYDYEAQYNDELSVFEGERLYIFESEDDTAAAAAGTVTGAAAEWVQVQPVDREAEPGIVPRAYIQVGVPDSNWEGDPVEDAAAAVTTVTAGTGVPDDREGDQPSEKGQRKHRRSQSSDQSTDRKTIFSTLLRKKKDPSSTSSPSSSTSSSAGEQGKMVAGTVSGECLLSCSLVPDFI